jgi:hypothetical protein
MTAMTRQAGAFPVAAGTALLGEVITWTCSGVAVRHLDLIDALSACGLDPAVARELAPRHAFTRACRKLSDRRIIRQVGEDEAHVRFQFTQESRHGDRFEYELETVLSLDKKSGAVTCDLPGLATLAQEEVDRCVAHRTGGDVTRIVQRLFERTADLFPIRPQGGAYFVPARHAPFVDRVQSLLGRLNGQVMRFPVPAGTSEGDRSVREAVAAGLSALVAEHRQAVAAFGADTRPGTVERAAEKIRATRFKVESYAQYLAEERDKLERDLAVAQQELRNKVEALAAAEPATVS